MASVAGPPSPEYPCSPAPATVVMVPVEASTLRTAVVLQVGDEEVPMLVERSPMGRGDLGTGTAGPPSPEYPSAPHPATVSMIPVAVSILRMRA